MVGITEQEYYKIAELIKETYGINLGDKKQVLLIGRLHNVLIENGIDNFTEYYNYVISDKTGRAINTLVNKITTNHTFFMRESEHFVYFKENILPSLKSRITDKDLRIWSAGCSSGEEPYTVAMILDEFFGAEKKQWDTKILATDICATVLEKAIRGEYSKESIDSLPPFWLSRYFRSSGTDKYLISDNIKKEIIFRRFNLMKSTFPFRRKFHVIFCRNVMIYFDDIVRKNLVNKFYDILEDGGYLVIGHSESLNRCSTKFKYVIPALYRKE
ncbi:CheR family methyltransferase [Clostridium oryzae]|uniref:protein-glutamate O-methyltransferase n=1 Tax=Clostridium oryzae TaxID=1450648 RepID=A0A1V4IQ00_9CLOT|nr:protein-glutamate O-methyltransferase CheR [Clostridium oryzae]OPJ61900.1 chemotaxis protein methyltransferase cher2 [Clostridium oryzae]